ncbi:MAG: thioesterase family protein [Moheibacter sp.]
MLSHISKFRVRFNETDPLGIVWHGHYVTYLEDGREAFGENFGISYKDIQNAGLFAPVVKCTVDYKLPLRHGDWATVETNYIDEVASKLHFTYKIFNSEDKLAATGETIQVFTDQKSGELFLSNPPFLEEWKKKHNLL